MQVSRPELHSVSRFSVSRELQVLHLHSVYFELERGRAVEEAGGWRVRRVFVSDEDTTLAINIKKGVISLFQLHTSNSAPHSEVGNSLLIHCFYMFLAVEEHIFYNVQCASGAVS